MNEEHDNENEDYDREELEHVENMLYANIHYNTGCDEQSTSRNQSLTEGDQATGDDSASNTPTGNSASRRNAKRYWSSKPAPGTSNFVPYFKEKQSGIYKTSKVVAVNLNNSTPEITEKPEPRETINVTPKQFTPYVSFLPFNDSISNDVEEATPTATTSTAKTNNDLLRKNLSTKQINPFSKKHTIDTYKQMFNDEETNEVLTDAIADALLESKKRLNPFNPLSRKAKKKKSEIKEINQNKSVRKNREELKQVAVNTSIIDVDVDDADDDVIILPTEAPPLVYIESSDDETSPANAQEHEFTEPNAVSENRRRPRCASPSSSIQSADDFIVQNEQRAFGFDTFGTLSDEDLCHVGETVENQLQNKKTGTSKRAAIPIDNDNAIFTPPKQIHKDKTKPIAKKSYEVAANSFTAVDVYESESSDMPDTIYAKGGQNKRKNISDSDTSSVDSISIVKSKAKRLRKRKSSGGAKESDQVHTDDSSSDLPEEEDDDETEGDEEPNENSYLVRGEALGKVKNINNRKKANKNVNEKRSEDDFINKLSSIVNGQNESDDNDDADSPRETSAESVEARDIVQAVLQRRTKKSKKNQPAEEDANQTENDKTKDWAITDQVGVTDVLNLAHIFDESASNVTNNGNDKSKNTETQSIQETVNKNESNPTVSNDQLQKTIDKEETAPSDTDILATEVGWNDEMRRFYNESWGGETFSVKNIRARMPRGFLNWMIINKDKFPSSGSNRGRQFRCLNCQDKGHLARNCPRPPSTKRCYMCGIEGHLEPKCPNKICLNCGKRTQKFQRGCHECGRDREIFCYVCKQKGHRQLLCPDRWRRYHSTTTTKTPLIEEQKPSGIRPITRYCCLCGNRGHYAEQCNRAIRIQFPLSMQVSSYRPLYNKLKEAQNTGPKCTILASDVDDYAFNFGNEVHGTGNTIYGRFRRAVNFNSNQTITSENDVVFVGESSLNDTSDPPIEVYDDYDSLDDELDDISSSEQFATVNVQDDSFMTINNLVVEEKEENGAVNEPEKVEKNNELSTEQQAEINQLDNKIETLTVLKERLLWHKSSNQTCQSTDTIIESDLNVSESKEDVSTTTVLPDFIPLSSTEPEKYEPTRSPSPVPADSTTTSSEKNDATIHLTSQYCKQLLTDQGNKYLRDSESQFDVSVRLEWRQFGNVLIVNGITKNQQDFHIALKEFFNSIDNSTQNSSIHLPHLPKNRDALIKYVRDQFAQLDTPLFNVRTTSDVQSIFHRIQSMEKITSKANNQKLSRMRKHLNMILFGRYGFGDGQIHINAVQDSLRQIQRCTQINVPLKVRHEISEHLEYIFSGKDHKNYADMIEQYNQMKRNKCLPPLNLDRKLIGLKINVHQVDQNNHQDSNTSRRNNNPRCNSSTLSMDSNKQKNKFNTTPSSIDIQINVSTPSTSSSYHNQNESMLNDTNFLSLKSSPLDRWKF